MITLKQLRYLDALEKHRHFGRAAMQCHITQPALSVQIADLERLLGLALVERLPRQVVFTEEGLEIVRRARDVLMATNDMVDYARHHGAVLSGGLRLGAIPSLAPYLLPRLLPRLRRRHGGMRLTLRETQTQYLLSDLLDGKIDLALLALPAETEGVEEMVLFEDPFLLALPQDHPLAQADEVAPFQLRNERLLLLEEGHCLRDQAITFCRTVGLNQFDDFGATSLTTVMQMVANQYGLTLLPRISLDVEGRSAAGVTIRPFKPPVPSRTIGLAWRRRSPRRADFVSIGSLIVDALGAEPVALTA